jgi:hypothetical protein
VTRGRLFGALVGGAVGWGLLLVGTVARYGRPLDDVHRHTSRFWEDTAVATSNYLNAGQAAPEANLASNEGGDLRNAYKRYMPKAALEAGIQPWQFWRTIEVKPFLKRERLIQRPYDDPGRALLMRLGYHAAGGVAPYVGLWLGVLFVGPVLFGLALELAAAGRMFEALALPVVLGSSAFVVDTLGLPYSAVGFYLIAGVLLIAFAGYACLSAAPTRRGLLARALGAGVYFALCAYTRSGTLLLAGGFLLAAGWGLERALRSEGSAPGLRPRALPALLLAGALLGPYALVRPPRHHGIWGDLWQGLGDFDRTRGHAWSDGELRQLLRRNGLKIGRNVGADFETPQTEATLRRIFISDITEAPGWYAGILVKRVGATLTQWKLRPWPALGGPSFAPQTSENEGLTDAYYAMVAPLDVFGLGGRRVELPLPLLWLAPLGLLVAWVRARRARDAEQAERRVGELGVIACLALATLPIPVIFSVSTAFETQCFGLVYLSAAVFALAPRPRRVAEP